MKDRRVASQEPVKRPEKYGGVRGPVRASGQEGTATGLRKCEDEKW